MAQTKNREPMICPHCGATVTVYAAMEHAYCPECGVSFRIRDAKNRQLDKELLDSLSGDACYDIIKSLPVEDAVSLYETAAGKGSYRACVRLACWHYNNVRYDRAIDLLNPYVSGDASDAIVLWCAASFYNCGRSNPPINDLKKWQYSLKCAKDGVEILKPGFVTSIADIIDRAIDRANYRSSVDSYDYTPVSADISVTDWKDMAYMQDMMHAGNMSSGGEYGTQGSYSSGV